MAIETGLLNAVQRSPDHQWAALHRTSDEHITDYPALYQRLC